MGYTEIIRNVILGLVLNAALLITQDTTGQVKTIEVRKVACVNEIKRDGGYKIVIAVDKPDTSFVTPVYYYNLDLIHQLPDSVKLCVIKALLTFKTDTSLCCLNVNGYYNDGLEQVCSVKPKSKNYTVQIDALYMINKIVHPDVTSLYSCFPVIVDKERNMEINGCPELIIDYYSVYEAWYEQCRKDKTLSKEFPFNTIKYCWFGSDSFKGTR